MSLTITPCDATLGDEIGGVDLRSLSGDDFAKIEQAWFTHAILIFRGQHLSQREQIDFTKRFGPLERSIIASQPEIANLSNVNPDGSVAPPKSERGLFLKGNTLWHTDSSFKRVPAKGSFLCARQIPSEGGETEFADMRAAYDALDDAMKDYLKGKTAVHSYAYSQGQVGGMSVLTEEEHKALPPVQHPLIRIHPETGRGNLYVSRHANHIIGEDEAESRALLKKLCEDGSQPPRLIKVTWGVGDGVLWDNRCVLHRGHDYPGDQARVMTRTTLAGDAADNEWAVEAAE
ncbi:MAG: TauD/TfdA family dioxygenase [Alphaproteobacteria bacterium]|nr:TauD/TfdA family dioxygenase [Alphaproteobacteria bacterium]